MFINIETKVPFLAICDATGHVMVIEKIIKSNVRSCAFFAEDQNGRYWNVDQIRPLSLEECKKYCLL
jgi:hypothetical protein